MINAKHKETIIETHIFNIFGRSMVEETKPRDRSPRCSVQRKVDSAVMNQSYLQLNPQLQKNNKRFVIGKRAFCGNYLRHIGYLRSIS